MPTLLPIRSVANVKLSINLADYESDSKQFVVQCPKGSAVGEGLFCCSADGKQECCDSQRNGLGIATSESLARASTANTATAPDPNSNTPSAVVFTSNSQSGSIAIPHVAPLVNSTTASSSTSSAWSGNASGHAVRPASPIVRPIVYTIASIFGFVMVCILGFVYGRVLWKHRQRQRVANVVTAPPQTLSSSAPHPPGDNNPAVGTESYGIELNELQASAETAAPVAELPTIPVSTSGQAFELPAGPARYRDFSTDGVNDERNSSDFLNPVTAEEILRSGPSNAQAVSDVQGDIDESPLRQESATDSGSDSTSDSFVYEPEYEIMIPPSYEAAMNEGPVAAASSASEQGERVTGTEGMLNTPAGSRRRRSTNTRQMRSP